MYIAHHLITIDNVFQHILEPRSPPPPALDPGVSGVHAGFHAGTVPVKRAELMEVVTWVKRLGNDNFTQHIALKKQQLSHHLRTDKGYLLLYLFIYSRFVNSIICDDNDDDDEDQPGVE